MHHEYRPLTQFEIKQLESQSCTCSDWSSVQVDAAFKADYIWQTSFSGQIRLGVFEKTITLAGNVSKHTGIENASIHNCTIGNNAYISKIHNRIANYNIGENVLIENAGLLAVTEKSSFGNGTRVAVINETGARSVPIYDNLSAQIAALLALYRHRPKLLEKAFGLIETYAASVSSEMGEIAEGASITNIGEIINVRIGACAIVDGAFKLENGTVNSCQADHAFIGTGVCAKNFITASGSRVDDAAIIHNCFVGQAVVIERQFSAENCAFFANCFASQGEACSAFAGPYTTTHHKASLLLTGLFSFFNAGSGTNHSNHHYKLGPCHQGIYERGCKTGSNAYIVWPARIGAFSTIIGSHYSHFDTSTMPFSYLLEDNGNTILAPAVALKSIGLVRDEHKWQKRDNRKDPNKLDLIIFDALSPYTIQNVISGRNQLANILTALRDQTPDSVSWNNVTIKVPALSKAIGYYELAMAQYLGKKVISRIEGQKWDDIAQLRELLGSGIALGRGRWLDLAGLIISEETVHKIINEIENGTAGTLEAIADSFKAFYKNYTAHEWRWTAAMLEDTLATNIDKMLPDDLIRIMQDYKSAVEKLNNMILDDGRKEFDNSVKIGYGFDGESAVRDADFEAVRGKFEDNDFVKHIRKSTAEKILAADNLIARLKSLRQQ